MGPIVVSGSFDNLRTPLLRLLELGCELGPLTVLLWSDETVLKLAGKPPGFPLEERAYLVSSVRFVREVRVVTDLRTRDELGRFEEVHPAIWLMEAGEFTEAKADYCRRLGITPHLAPASELRQFPDIGGEVLGRTPGKDRRRVLVTGCFDWLHSGHVRFFEEVSQLGDLYVVVGSDANIRHLKGDGHPLLSQEERRYAVGAIRFVARALVSSGRGWVDAEPEVLLIRPDCYAVNEDGDRPEKREFCARNGIDYVVLKRFPRPGLPARSSTALRGF